MLTHLLVITTNLANPSVALYKPRKTNLLDTAISSADCCPYHDLGKGSCVDEDGGLPAYYYEIQGYSQLMCQDICNKDDLCTGYSMRELMPGRLPGCYIFSGGRLDPPSDEIPKVKGWAFQLGTGSLLPISRVIDNSQYTCMKKHIGTCTLVENLHVNSFNGRQVTLQFSRNGSDTKSGVKWLVKNRRVSIQARLEETGLYNRSISVKAIAVGGAFLKGNIFMISTLEHRITWNGDAVLENHSSSFQMDHNDFFVKAKRSNLSLLAEDRSTQRMGVSVAFPSGVKLIVNRLRDRIDVVIKMPPQEEEGQEGICGDFNGVVAENEIANPILQVFDPDVPPGELLFGERRAARRIQLIQGSMLKQS